MGTSPVDPLRAFPSYASLVSFLISIDLQSPLVGKLLQLLIHHPNLTLSEISKAFREEEESGRNRRGVGGGEGRSLLNALSSPSLNQHPSLTVRSPLCLDTGNPEALKSSAKTAPRLDAALRELMSRLVLHRVIACGDSKDRSSFSSGSEYSVQNSSSTCYYSLQSGTTLLLRLYYPLVLQWVRNRFGDVGERLASIVHQLGIVPLSSAIEILANAAVAAKELPPPLSLPTSLHSSPSNSAVQREVTRTSTTSKNADVGGGERELTRNSPAARTRAWVDVYREVGIAMVQHGVFEVVNSDVDDTNMGENRNHDRGWGNRNEETEMRKKAVCLENGSSISISPLLHSPDISHWYIRWNVSHLVHLLLHSAMRQLVQGRVADFSGSAETIGVPSIILDVFFSAQEKTWLQVSNTASRCGSSFSGGRQADNDRNSLHFSNNTTEYGGAGEVRSNMSVEERRRGGSKLIDAFGFPLPLPSVSAPPVPLSALVNAVQNHYQQKQGSLTSQKIMLLEDQVRRVLECLQDDAIGRSGLVGRPKRTGAAKTAAFVISGLESSHNTLYHLHYGALCAALRLTVVEKVIFARHGVLGVRAFKLLTSHHFLEDKGLAELLVAAQPQTRELLHDMMKDGLLQQKEISKVDVSVTSERQPKHQIYLWGFQEETQLMPRIREIIAQSLLKAVFRLNTLRHGNSGALSSKEEMILQDPNFCAPYANSSSSNGNASAPGQNKENGRNCSDGRVKEEESHESFSTFLPHVGFPPFGGPDTGIKGGKDRLSLLPTHPEDFDALVHHHRQLLGIENVVLAHMRMLFIMDFV